MNKIYTTILILVLMLNAYLSYEMYNQDFKIKTLEAKIEANDNVQLMWEINTLKDEFQKEKVFSDKRFNVTTETLQKFAKIADETFTEVKQDITDLQNVVSDNADLYNKHLQLHY